VDRLTTIAQAVKASEAQTAQAVGGITGATEAVGREAATAKAEAGVTRAGLSRAQREASRAVESARRSPAVPTPGEDQVSRMLTEQEDAFSKSSLGKRPSAAQEVSDVAYATFAPPGSPRQVAGLARLIWRGPNVNDLIHWASLTDDNTQLLVRAVSSPNASQTVAALARGVQEIITQHSGRGRAKSGTPPPALVKPALTPPPGPPR
jgi:hypothetical protein